MSSAALRAGWKVTTLPSIATKFCDGPFGSNLKSAHYAEEGIRVIRLQNVGVGEMRNDHLAFISREHYETLPRNHCKPGDVIIGTLGEPNLRACIVPSDLTDSLNKADCVLMRVNRSLADPEYVCSMLNSEPIVQMAMGLVRGQTRGRISMGRLKELPVPLPPLDVQRRIAAILDAADALRVKRRASLEQLDTLLQSTFLEMFGDPVTNPKGWEKTPLGKLGDILTGFAFPSSEFLPSQSGISLCRGINIGIGRLEWKDRADWALNHANKFERFQLSAGDIVLAMDRPWVSSGLKIAIVSHEDLPSLLVQRVSRIRCRSQTARTLIYVLINSSAFERHCKPTETTVPHISPKDIRAFPVIQPPLDLQRKFATIVESVEKQKERQRAHLAELDTLFASLQQRAFRGDL